MAEKDATPAIGATMRSQLNVRVPDTTRRQIDQLADMGYESQAHVVMMAVDRLYTQEINKMNDDFGTVTFEGITFRLTEVATADNYGTNGKVRYYAKAIGSDGELYRIAWDTTEAWDLAQEREALRADSFLSPEEKNRRDKLWKMILPDVSDESNACDWDLPVEAILL